jgi:hypothetical protein
VSPTQPIPEPPAFSRPPAFAVPEGAPPPPAAPAAAPFGAPFALPDDSGEETPFGGTAEPRTGFGWAWEPPEEEPPPKAP